MQGIQGLQFFVLDFSVIILAFLVIVLAVGVYVLYRKARAQQRHNERMGKTIDRILKIEAGAGGGIDGWEMARQERKRSETSKKSGDPKPK